MNARFLFLCLLGWLLLPVAACSDLSTREQVTETERLLATTDSLSAELRAIDTTEVTALLEAAQEVKVRFREHIGNDTLGLAFAEELESFLLAIGQLEHWNEERTACLEAADQLHKRLKALHSDLESGAGERARYAEFVRKERRQTKAVAAHGRELLDNYRAATAALTQFQPGIERFTTGMVQPV